MIPRILAAAKCEARLLPVIVVLSLLLLPACAQLPQEVQGDQLEQRLRVAQQCTLMGSKEASPQCEAVRQALIGRTTTEADKLALSCFDALHASNLNAAKKAFNSGIATAPTNPHILACGSEIATIEKK
jgi:hypothetical protein